MVMTTFSSETILTVLVLGRSTSIPDSRIGAVNMQLINSTRTTSTKGVMLMSDRDDWVLPLGLVKAIVHLLNSVTSDEWHVTSKNRWGGLLAYHLSLVT